MRTSLGPVDTLSSSSTGLLAAGEVHVWWFKLDRAPGELAKLLDVLDDDERQRVARFHFRRDADRAAAARGLLRGLLGRYVGIAPRELRFEYGAQGKPTLSGQPLQFNLSHSAGLGACAITLDQPTGIDLEYIQADFDYARIARQSFSAAEQAELARTPDARAFYRCWTLKEAYIKARGGGLSIPLSAFDVPLGESGLAQPVLSREPASDAHGWFVRPLDAPAGFAAATAVRSPIWSVRQWHLPG